MITEYTYCDALVETEVIGEYKTGLIDNLYFDEKYIFLKFKKCFSPILVLQKNSWNPDYGGDNWNEPIRLYPNNEFQIDPSIPKLLRDSYQEAILCFKGRAYTATAILCRRTIEGIALEKQINFKNLAVALKKLNENKVINDQLFEWADELRLSGNDAAHDIKIAFTKQDAQDILLFTNAILNYVYSFQEKFSDFKNRRRKNSAQH